MDYDADRYEREVRGITSHRRNQQILQGDCEQTIKMIRLEIAPVSRNTGKYRFFSKELHQFHALVNRPSMQLPAS